MLQRIPLQTVEGVEDNQAGFLHVFKERDDAFLPVAPLDLAFKKVAAVLGKRPFKQGVDILKVMEAHLSLMELENIRILKEMRGNVNRQVNCETANINKTVSAAVKQIEDIEFIRDTVGFESLPDGLAQIARARLLKPEATLKELGEDLEPPVGKSGVNHRLRKLGEMAEKLREQGTET